MKAAHCLFGLALSALAVSQTPVPQSLTIEEAVQFGLKNSPVLRGAEAEIQAAKAETRVSRSRLFPQVGLNGFATQGSMSNILQSTMGFEPQALLLAPKDGFTDLNLTLMMPLYTGGTLSSLVAAAIARERAVYQEATGMAAEVALMIRTAYAQALYGEALADAARARVEAATGMVAVARAQVEAGKGIEANVQRSEAELAEAQQDLTMAENDRRKMLLDLLEAMGAPLSSLPELGEKPSFQVVAGSLDGYLGQAKERRGELLAARQKSAAAKADVDAKLGAIRPQVYGFAMGDAFNPRDEMGNRSGYTAGLVASFPLFDGGMRRSEVSASRAMYEKARADASAWELKTEKEVRQAWLDVETVAKNYATATAALASAQASYEVMKLRVEAGKAILVEQLDALATLTRARSNLAKATFDHFVAKARLLRAVGHSLQSPGGTPK